jgi:hypothetical protein
MISRTRNAREDSTVSSSSATDRPAAPPVAPGDVAAADRLRAHRCHGARLLPELRRRHRRASRYDSDDAIEAAAAVRDTGAGADTAPAEAAARLAVHLPNAGPHTGQLFIKIL